MDFDKIFESIEKRATKNTPLGATVKFVVDDKIIFVDGNGESNLVSQDDKEANCTIKMSQKTLGKLISGDMNPMLATMTGKLKISGDMGLAMKLQSLI